MVEDITESRCSDKENGASCGCTPTAEEPQNDVSVGAPLKKVDVKDLEQTVDSLNKKVQQLLAQSQEKPYSAVNTVRRPFELLGTSKSSIHVNPTETEMRITDHITSMVDRLDSHGKPPNSEAPTQASADDTEYQELASRVQQIFQREATHQKLSSSISESPNASFNYTAFDKSGASSYFIKGYFTLSSRYA